MVYAAVMAVCLASPLAQAADPPASACKYREEPLAVPAAAAGAPQKARNRVTLLVVSPAEGAEVRASSVLEVDVEYEIAGFAARRFFLMARFPTLSLGSMSPGDRSDQHFLQAASGRLHLCVPLAEVYENSGVAWPLSFEVSIFEELSSDGRSVLVADSRKVKLNSVDIPAGVQERQKMLPEDVQRALMMVFGHIEEQGALNKVCPARLVDMQATFPKAYRAWESRNAATIRQIQEMQYGLYRDTVSNPADAARSFDATRDAYIRYLKALKESALRARCAETLESLSDDTSDLAVATAVNLEVVQEYLAHQQKKKGSK
jgi:hypothetical protein